MIDFRGDKVFVGSKVVFAVDDELHVGRVLQQLDDGKFLLSTLRDKGMRYVRKPHMVKACD